MPGALRAARLRVVFQYSEEEGLDMWVPGVATLAARVPSMCQGSTRDSNNTHTG